MILARIACAGLTVLLIATSGLFAAEVKPLRALLITGGGYHDYKTQKKILTEGVSARANVVWTVVLENPGKGEAPKVFANADWIKGYDVIVHNQCFAAYSDDEGIEKIVKAHTDTRTGAVMIHCAMHAFRDAKKTKAWDKLTGVESRRHGAKFPIVVKNLGRKHPITGKLPGTWTTPKGELYHTTLLPSATQLAVGFKEGEELGTTQSCVWTNLYQKCRVFATTLGHHNETMQEPGYLDMVTNGLLWSCGKLDDQGKPLAGYGKTAAVRIPTKFQVVTVDGKSYNFASLQALAKSGLSFADRDCCGK